MFGAMKDHIANEIEQIKEAGLYKSERIITSPQQAEITVTFDPDAFLAPLPGINNVWNQANLGSDTWMEIAPAP